MGHMPKTLQKILILYTYHNKFVTRNPEKLTLYLVLFVKSFCLRIEFAREASPAQFCTVHNPLRVFFACV